MRYYAPWLCRFVSVDPLAAKYAYYTPYQYAGNKPIIAVDVDGLESSVETGQQNLSSNSTSDQKVKSPIKSGNHNDANIECHSCPKYLPKNPKDGDIFESKNSYFIAKDGAWSETLPEAVVTGFYASHMINIKTKNGRTFAMYDFGYNSIIGDNTGFNVNVTGFRGEYGLNHKDYSIGGFVKATAFEASITQKLNMGALINTTTAKVNVFLAKADAEVGLLREDNGDWSIGLDASAEATALRAEFNDKIELLTPFGPLKVTFGLVGREGAVSGDAGLKVGEKENSIFGEAHIGGSILYGGSAKIKIEFPNGRSSKVGTKQDQKRAEWRRAK